MNMNSEMQWNKYVSFKHKPETKKHRNASGKGTVVDVHWKA